MSSKEGKPRFNENVEEEARSIRDDISITANKRLSKSLLKNRVSGVGIGSRYDGTSSLNPYSIHESIKSNQTLTTEQIRRTIDRNSSTKKSVASAFSSRYSKRSSQQRATLKRI